MLRFHLVSLHLDNKKILSSWSAPQLLIVYMSRVCSSIIFIMISRYCVSLPLPHPSPIVHSERWLVLGKVEKICCTKTHYNAFKGSRVYPVRIFLTWQPCKCNQTFGNLANFRSPCSSPLSLMWQTALSSKPKLSSLALSVFLVKPEHPIYLTSL